MQPHLNSCTPYSGGPRIRRYEEVVGQLTMTALHGAAAVSMSAKFTHRIQVDRFIQTALMWDCGTLTAVSIDPDT